MHNLHPGCKFAPGYIFGHVNGVLRICTRVQVCSYFQGGADLFAPGCKMCIWTQNMYFLYVSIGDFVISQTFSVYDFVLNDIKIKGGGVPYVPTHQFSSSFACLIPSMYQL